MEKLADMGYIDFTGYTGGGDPPEYIDVGYAFFAITYSSKPQKFLGVFEAKADASKEIGQNVMLNRAIGLVERFDEAAKTNSNWLTSPVDTWDEPTES